MGNIYLVRHGITDYNKENRYQGQLDIPLNLQGRDQAKRVAKALADEDINVMYSSDLKRAYETAEFIALATNQKIKILQDLREVDVGVLEGMLWDDVKKQYPEWLKSGRNQGYPGGESRADIEKRVQNLWEYTMKNHRKDNVVLVSHGGIIKTLICQILGISANKRSRFVIDNCSITTIVSNNSGVMIKTLNSIWHLD